MAGQDVDEPYSGLDPTVPAAVLDFYDTLPNPGSASATLRLFVPDNFGPAFEDDTGDAISGTVGTAIADVVVRKASGFPTPTHAVVGSLPAGVSFDTVGVPENAAGVLEFDEDAIEPGSDTITIRATNSEGTADWTVDYEFFSAEVVADPGETAAGNPEATLSASRVAPPLTLDDIAIPDGRQLAGAASLIVIGASGDVYNADAVVSAGADPPNIGAQAPTRIFVTGRSQLRMSATTGGDIEAEWSAGGALEDYQLHVQTSATEIVSYGRGDVDAAPSNFRRLIVGAVNDPDGLLDDVEALTSGDVVIWFLTEPIPPADVSIDPGTTEASTPEASLAAVPTIDPVTADPGETAPANPEASLSAVPTVDPVTADPGETAAANPEASLSAVPTVGVPTADPGETAAGDPVASLSAVPTIDPVAADPGTTTAGNPEAELTAAVQTVPVGVSVFDLGNLGFRDGPWEGAIRIDPRYIENGAEAWLRYLDRSATSIRLRLSSTETEEPSDEGPEFTPALKEYESALTFTDDDGSIVLPGPGHDSNSFSDPTEPYFWTPPAALGWAAWVQNITGNVTLTLDDGVEIQPSLADPGTTSAGSPEAELTAIPMVDPVAVDTGQVAAGNPQAELTAVPTLDPVLVDPGSTSAGNPGATLPAVVHIDPVGIDLGETIARDPQASLTALVRSADPILVRLGTTAAPAPRAELAAVVRDFSAIWPGDLPSTFLQRGFRMSPEDSAARFEPDRGRSLRRRRYTRSQMLIQGVLRMTPAEWATFKKFYNDTLAGGQVRFEFPKPLAATSIEVEFTRTPQRSRRGIDWDVTLNLKMP